MQIKNTLRLRETLQGRGRGGGGTPSMTWVPISGLYGCLLCNRGQSPSIHCGSKLAGGRLPVFHQWNFQKLLQWGHAEHSKKQAVVPTEISKKLPSMTLWAIPREMLPYGCAELPGKTFHGETITSEMPQLEWNSPLRILNHVVEGHARSLESGWNALLPQVLAGLPVGETATWHGRSVPGT